MGWRGPSGVRGGAGCGVVGGECGEHKNYPMAIDTLYLSSVSIDGTIADI